MSQYLRIILPAYCVLYFLFLIVIRAWAVQKQIGKNPVFFSFSDDLHGLVSKYFGIWMALLFVYTLLFSVYPSAYPYFMPMDYFESNLVKTAGLIILATSLIGTYIAQGNMKKSWRVGIDQQQKTDLVTTGIFRYSRNPIYVGMLASIIGLFMVTPNGFTLLLLVIGYLLIQVQVRVEEDFLLGMHGDEYVNYKASVRRFI
jgi:protein-S-isoprenylcysteine O-methyltransferase Ste14